MVVDIGRRTVKSCASFGVVAGTSTQRTSVTSIAFERVNFCSSADASDGKRATSVTLTTNAWYLSTVCRNSWNNLSCIVLTCLMSSESIRHLRELTLLSASSVVFPSMTKMKSSRKTPRYGTMHSSPSRRRRVAPPCSCRRIRAAGRCRKAVRGPARRGGMSGAGGGWRTSQRTCRSRRACRSCASPCSAARRRRRTRRCARGG